MEEAKQMTLYSWLKNATDIKCIMKYNKYAKCM